MDLLPIMLQVALLVLGKEMCKSKAMRRSEELSQATSEFFFCIDPLLDRRKVLLNLVLWWSLNTSERTTTIIPHISHPSTSSLARGGSSTTVPLADILATRGGSSITVPLARGGSSTTVPLARGGSSTTVPQARDGSSTTVPLADILASQGW